MNLIPTVRDYVFDLLLCLVLLIPSHFSPSLPFQCFSQGDSAPLSASLLADWLEVHRMNPADMESLQQELQLGSPMILSDIPDLQDA